MLAGLAPLTHRFESQQVVCDGEAEGVLFSQGARAGGHALYLRDGRLHYTYNWLGEKVQTVTADRDVPTGKHIFTAEFQKTGDDEQTKSARGTITLYIDDEPVGKAEILTQPRPGGIILAPWQTPWISWGTARLTVQDDGSAQGDLLPYGTFMSLRQQRLPNMTVHEVVDTALPTDQSFTTLDPWETAVRDEDARFALGLYLRDVRYTTHYEPGIDGVKDRLWFWDGAHTSWAAVDWNGDDAQTSFAVTQAGPRRLWVEVERAFQWWKDNDCPGPARFRMTVAPSGRHRYALDEPDRFLN